MGRCVRNKQVHFKYVDTRYQAYYLDGHVMFVQITLYADSIFRLMIQLLGIASIAMDK